MTGLEHLREMLDRPRKAVKSWKAVSDMTRTELEEAVEGFRLYFEIQKVIEQAKKNFEK